MRVNKSACMFNIFVLKDLRKTFLKERKKWSKETNIWSESDVIYNK